MTSSNRKLAILEQLNREMHAIGLIELLNKLPEQYAERSVRRWLKELADECLIEISGFKRGTKYQVTQKKTEPNQDMKTCFSAESAIVITQVRQPIYERQPISYDETWLNRYQPNLDFYIPMALRNELQQAGSRSSGHDPAGTYAHQIYNRLLIDLSYNSSRLEGNTYSLLDTERLLLGGKTPEGKLDEEKIMILNHKEAIRYLVDNANRMTISTETVCTLHYLLSDGLIESKYAGKVRDHAVRIGGSTYMPLDESKQLLKQLTGISDKAKLIQDPFEQSLFLLVHISYLQAFSDVNKRTARLSSNISLITNNLVPLSFNDLDRDDYMSAMIAAYELQDVRPIVDLYEFSYLRTCAAYDATVKSIGFDEVRVRYRQQRRDMLREVITHSLVGDIMKRCIETRTKEWILNTEDQASFIEDVLDDIEHIDQNRIQGLGITTRQLNEWLKLK